MGRKKDKDKSAKDKKKQRATKSAPAPAPAADADAVAGWDGSCGGENTPVAISCTQCAEAFHSKSVAPCPCLSRTLERSSYCRSRSVYN